MKPRVIAVLVAMALTVVVAGALWAQYGAKPQAGQVEGQSEVDRCSMTCSMLVNHWNKKYAAMRAHEGDKQCWDTCWSRFGEGRGESAAEMKALWMGRMAESMRTNQCSQACWRKFHDDSNTVAVGGWRSTPRTIVCTP